MNVAAKTDTDAGACASDEGASPTARGHWAGHRGPAGHAAGPMPCSSRLAASREGSRLVRAPPESWADVGRSAAHPACKGAI
eukprot:366029-Chlamydomonas_euryale.AAC.2